MIEQGIYQLVTQNSSVQAAIGTGNNSAYWVLAPQGATLPMLIFSRVATTDTTAMSGAMGLREALLQIVCYSTTYYGSRSVAEVVRKCLSSYKGTLPDVDSTKVDSIIIEKDFDNHYEEGNKAFIFGAYLQFRVWYQD